MDEVTLCCVKWSTVSVRVRWRVPSGGKLAAALLWGSAGREKEEVSSGMPCLVCKDQDLLWEGDFFALDFCCL